MARHPRAALPGVALHVIQRGNNRSACFRADGDYLTYLAHLRYLAGKYGCDVHAYCLMTNHVHLLLTPSDTAGCGLLMRDLGRSYVPYFNRRYGRTGTLWQGRFRSCLVESARYVLACHCYIELNPVRAGMVSDARAFPWLRKCRDACRPSSDPALRIRSLVRRRNSAPRRLPRTVRPRLRTAGAALHPRGYPSRFAARERRIQGKGAGAGRTAIGSRKARAEGANARSRLALRTGSASATS